MTLKLAPIYTLAALSAVLTLAACEKLSPSLVEPGAAPVVTPASSRPEPSALSKELSTYYSGVQSKLVSQGLLRTDRGGFAAPNGARELAENFVRIALFEEYTHTSQGLIANPNPSRLRRWDGPVTIGVSFGKTVPTAQRRKDMRNISNYAGRLSRLTGLPVTVSNVEPNFHVLILNEDERRNYGPHLETLIPVISSRSVATITDLPRGTFCLVNAFAGSANSAAYYAAVAVIRAEHPDRLRLSCIHEELAQGMGLANDSPAARPSIFNDDEEFGLLTMHDELLLRLLYDPRLTIGMDEEEARPIVQSLAQELTGGS